MDVDVLLFFFPFVFNSLSFFACPVYRDFFKRGLFHGTGFKSPVTLGTCLYFLLFLPDNIGPPFPQRYNPTPQHHTRYGRFFFVIFFLKQYFLTATLQKLFTHILFSYQQYRNRQKVSKSCAITVECIRPRREDTLQRGGD